jgi:hypothetical protein
MVDLTMCPFKVFQRIKVCFKNDRINMLYAIQPEATPAKYHVDSSFTIATKYMSFASTSLYWPPFVGLHMAHGEDGGSLLPSFRCVYVMLNSVI